MAFSTAAWLGLGLVKEELRRARPTAQILRVLFAFDAFTSVHREHRGLVQELDGRVKLVHSLEVESDLC